MELGTDSSAAKGICLRRGIGKLRHLDTQYLWVQDIFYKKLISLFKVKGTENDADIGTKYLSAKEIFTILNRLGYEMREGASRIAKQAAL